MYDDIPARRPAALDRIRAAAASADFTLSSEVRTGALLATLAATRPGGRFLELGTGVGEGTAWLLDGMDADARLVSVERDAAVQDVARAEFGDDPRVELVTADGGAWLESYAGPLFDLVFADTWPGKFSCLDRALDLVAPAGVYLVDDLAPAADWPADHAASVRHLLAAVEGRPDFHTVRLDWSSGLLLAVRTGAGGGDAGADSGRG
ncbi:O-methyltransferase [Streptomyces sp. NPDC060194]|uniref:O-methyltransferase n=1 Tax=Streptomyces sp. NPDC060194 TaxID=3347069 RepID=UPI00365E34FA